MTLETRPPSGCTTERLRAFCDFVREGRQVHAAGLEGRVRGARALVFLHDEATLVGTAAIKSPSPHYRRSVFESAGVPEVEHAYSLELGWVVVRESHQNRKLSRQLVEAAIAAFTGVPLFATSRSDKKAMHRTLARFGFRNLGRPYQSAEEEAEVLLFVRNAT